MTRPAFILTGLLTSLLVACATPAREPPAAHPSSHQDHPMTAAGSEPAALATAHDAAQRLLAFLSNVQSSADFATAQVGQRMGVALTPDPANGEGWTAYRSGDLGNGWSYGVQQAEPRPPQGRAFGFWFYNDDRTADPAPVCALPLDELRASLTQHGWVERPVPSEIGSVLAVEFAKHDLVLTLTPRDVVPHGSGACVLSLLATGGH